MFKIVFEGTFYSSTCMPNGLPIAPYLFTKLLKLVLSELRHNGILVVYLDDILVIGKTYDQCQHGTHFTLSLLKSLGFLLNATEKYSFTY